MHPKAECHPDPALAPFDAALVPTLEIPWSGPVTVGIDYATHEKSLLGFLEHKTASSAFDAQVDAVTKFIDAQIIEELKTQTSKCPKALWKSLYEMDTS